MLWLKEFFLDKKGNDATSLGLGRRDVEKVIKPFLKIESE